MFILRVTFSISKSTNAIVLHVSTLYENTRSLYSMYMSINLAVMDVTIIHVSMYEYTIHVINDFLKTITVYNAVMV